MGSQLTVNNYVIAELQLQPVRLRQVLGGYELSFSALVTIPSAQGRYLWLRIYGARVELETASGKSAMPYAFVEQPVFLQKIMVHDRSALELLMNLSPQQLEALEMRRNGDDLRFHLQLNGEGGETQNFDMSRPQKGEASFHVHQSEWVKQLELAKALDILMLEIPMPHSDSRSDNQVAKGHLIAAQKHFVNGNYGECVLECRKFCEEYGGDKLTRSLKALATNQKDMVKDERQSVLLAALRHYAHPTAHSERLGGEQYDRDDAKLVLSIAAALAGHPFG